MKELLANYTPLSTAMLQNGLQGLQNEDSIAQAFINKLDSEEKKGVSIQHLTFDIWHNKVWLFHQQNPWLFKCKQDGIIIDEEDSTRGVVELKFIQVKPGETLTHVLFRQNIIQVKNEIKKPQMYQKMFVTEYHWEFSLPRRLMEVCLWKVKFNEEFWSPKLKKNWIVFWHIPCLWTCLSKSSTWTGMCCLLKKLYKDHYIDLC